MPYCEPCDKYLAPSAMNADGTCPTCGNQIADPAEVEAASKQEVDDEKAPWHFKLLVVLLVVYLGWRFFQLLF